MGKPKIASEISSGSKEKIDVAETVSCSSTETNAPLAPVPFTRTFRIGEVERELSACSANGSLPTTDLHFSGSEPNVPFERLLATPKIIEPTGRLNDKVCAELATEESVVRTKARDRWQLKLWKPSPRLSKRLKAEWTPSTQFADNAKPYPRPFVSVDSEDALDRFFIRFPEDDESVPQPLNELDKFLALFSDESIVTEDQTLLTVDSNHKFGLIDGLARGSLHEQVDKQYEGDGDTIVDIDACLIEHCSHALGDAIYMEPFANCAALKTYAHSSSPEHAVELKTTATPKLEICSESQGYDAVKVATVEPVIKMERPLSEEVLPLSALKMSSTSKPQNKVKSWRLRQGSARNPVPNADIHSSVLGEVDVTTSGVEVATAESISSMERAVSDAVLPKPSTQVSEQSQLQETPPASQSAANLEEHVVDREHEMKRSVSLPSNVGDVSLMSDNWNHHSANRRKVKSWRLRQGSGRNPVPNADMHSSVQGEVDVTTSGVEVATAESIRSMERAVSDAVLPRPSTQVFERSQQQGTPPASQSAANLEEHVVDREHEMKRSVSLASNVGEFSLMSDNRNEHSANKRRVKSWRLRQGSGRNHVPNAEIYSSVQGEVDVTTSGVEVATAESIRLMERAVSDAVLPKPSTQVSEQSKLQETPPASQSTADHEEHVVDGVHEMKRSVSLASNVGDVSLMSDNLSDAIDGMACGKQRAIAEAPCKGYGDTVLGNDIGPIVLPWHALEDTLMEREPSSNGSARKTGAPLSSPELAETMEGSAQLKKVNNSKGQEVLTSLDVKAAPVKSIRSMERARLDAELQNPCNQMSKQRQDEETLSASQLTETSPKLSQPKSAAYLSASMPPFALKRESGAVKESASNTIPWADTLESSFESAIVLKMTNVPRTMVGESQSLSGSSITSFSQTGEHVSEADATLALNRPMGRRSMQLLEESVFTLTPKTNKPLSLPQSTASLNRPSTPKIDSLLVESASGSSPKAETRFSTSKLAFPVNKLSTRNIMLCESTSLSLDSSMDSTLKTHMQVLVPESTEAKSVSYTPKLQLGELMKIPAESSDSTAHLAPVPFRKTSLLKKRAEFQRGLSVSSASASPPTAGSDSSPPEPTVAFERIGAAPKIKEIIELKSDVDDKLCVELDTEEPVRTNAGDRWRAGPDKLSTRSSKHVEAEWTSSAQMADNPKLYPQAFSSVDSQDELEKFFVLFPEDDKLIVTENQKLLTVDGRGLLKYDNLNYKFDFINGLSCENLRALVDAPYEGDGDKILDTNSGLLEHPSHALDDTAQYMEPLANGAAPKTYAQFSSQELAVALKTSTTPKQEIFSDSRGCNDVKVDTVEAKIKMEQALSDEVLQKHVTHVSEKTTKLADNNPKRYARLSSSGPLGALKMSSTSKLKKIVKSWMLRKLSVRNPVPNADMHSLVQGEVHVTTRGVEIATAESIRSMERAVSGAVLPKPSTQVSNQSQLQETLPASQSAANLEEHVVDRVHEMKRSVSLASKIGDVSLMNDNLSDAIDGMTCGKQRTIAEARCEGYGDSVLNSDIGPIVLPWHALEDTLVDLEPLSSCCAPMTGAPLSSPELAATIEGSVTDHLKEVGESRGDEEVTSWDVKTAAIKSIRSMEQARLDAELQNPCAQMSTQRQDEETPPASQSTEASPRLSHPKSVAYLSASMPLLAPKRSSSDLKEPASNPFPRGNTLSWLLESAIEPETTITPKTMIGESKSLSGSYISSFCQTGAHESAQDTTLALNRSITLRAKGGGSQKLLEESVFALTPKTNERLTIGSTLPEEALPSQDGEDVSSCGSNRERSQSESDIHLSTSVPLVAVNKSSTSILKKLYWPLRRGPAQKNIPRSDIFSSVQGEDDMTSSDAAEPIRSMEGAVSDRKLAKPCTQTSKQSQLRQVPPASQMATNAEEPEGQNAPAGDREYQIKRSVSLASALLIRENLYSGIDGMACGKLRGIVVAPCEGDGAAMVENDLGSIALNCDALEDALTDSEPPALGAASNADEHLSMTRSATRNQTIFRESQGDVSLGVEVTLAADNPETHAEKFREVDREHKVQRSVSLTLDDDESFVTEDGTICKVCCIDAMACGDDDESLVTEDGTIFKVCCIDAMVCGKLPENVEAPCEGDDDSMVDNDMGPIVPSLDALEDTVTAIEPAANGSTLALKSQDCEDVASYGINLERSQSEKDTYLSASVPLGALNNSSTPKLKKVYWPLRRWSAKNTIPNVDMHSSVKGEVDITSHGVEVVTSDSIGSMERAVLEAIPPKPSTQTSKQSQQWEVQPALQLATNLEEHKAQNYPARDRKHQILRSVSLAYDEDASLIRENLYSSTDGMACGKLRGIVVAPCEGDGAAMVENDLGSIALNYDALEDTLTDSEPSALGAASNADEHVSMTRSATRNLMIFRESQGDVSLGVEVALAADSPEAHAQKFREVDREHKVQRSVSFTLDDDESLVTEDGTICKVCCIDAMACGKSPENVEALFEGDDDSLVDNDMGPIVPSLDALEDTVTAIEPAVNGSTQALKSQDCDDVASYGEKDMYLSASSPLRALNKSSTPKLKKLYWPLRRGSAKKTIPNVDLHSSVKGEVDITSHGVEVVTSDSIGSMERAVLEAIPPKPSTQTSKQSQQRKVRPHWQLATNLEERQAQNDPAGDRKHPIKRSLCENLYSGIDGMACGKRGIVVAPCEGDGDAMVENDMGSIALNCDALEDTLMDSEFSALGAASNADKHLSMTRSATRNLTIFRESQGDVSLGVEVALAADKPETHAEKFREVDREHKVQSSGSFLFEDDESLVTKNHMFNCIDEMACGQLREVVEAPREGGGDSMLDNDIGSVVLSRDALEDTVTAMKPTAYGSAELEEALKSQGGEDVTVNGTNFKGTKPEADTHLSTSVPPVALKRLFISKLKKASWRLIRRSARNTVLKANAHLSAQGEVDVSSSGVEVDVLSSGVEVTTAESIRKTECAGADVALQIPCTQVSNQAEADLAENPKPRPHTFPSVHREDEVEKDLRIGSEDHCESVEVFFTVDDKGMLHDNPHCIDGLAFGMLRVIVGGPYQHEYDDFSILDLSAVGDNVTHASVQSNPFGTNLICGIDNGRDTTPGSSYCCTTDTMGRPNTTTATDSSLHLPTVDTKDFNSCAPGLPEVMLKLEHFGAVVPLVPPKTERTFEVTGSTSGQVEKGRPLPLSKKNSGSNPRGEDLSCRSKSPKSALKFPLSAEAIPSSNALTEGVKDLVAYLGVLAPEDSQTRGVGSPSTPNNEFSFFDGLKCVNLREITKVLVVESNILVDAVCAGCVDGDDYEYEYDDDDADNSYHHSDYAVLDNNRGSATMLELESAYARLESALAMVECRDVFPSEESYLSLKMKDGSPPTTTSGHYGNLLALGELTPTTRKKLQAVSRHIKRRKKEATAKKKTQAQGPKRLSSGKR